MSKNKKYLYLGLVIILFGIWTMIPAMTSPADIAGILGIIGIYATPIGFILMLVGIFMKAE